MARQSGTAVNCIADAATSLLSNMACGQNRVREDTAHKVERVGNELLHAHVILFKVAQAIEDGNLLVASRLLKEKMEFGFEP